MSDNIEAVINSAVADAGDIAPAGDTSTETASVDTSTDQVEAAGTTQPAQTQPVVEEDPFAKEYGLATRRADGKDNRIPYPRVKAIADNQVKKVVGQIAKELGITKAEAELKLDDVMGELGTRKTKFSEYESRLQSIDAIEQIMQGDPDRFLTMLAEANPAYQKFLKQQAAAETKPAATTGDDPMPEPDYPFTDAQGNVVGQTYSMDGMQKRMAWERRQAVRDSEAKLNERLGPIEKERQAAAKADADKRAHAEWEGKATARINARLEKMAKRHGWKDNEAAILKAVQGGADLEDAYYDVVFPTIAGDRTKMRTEILAELKGAPAATNTSANVQPAATPANASLDDIILQSIKGLK